MICQRKKQKTRNIQKRRYLSYGNTLQKKVEVANAKEKQKGNTRGKISRKKTNNIKQRQKPRLQIRHGKTKQNAR